MQRFVFLFLSLFCLCFATESVGQFGISAKYNNNSYKEWNNTVADQFSDPNFFSSSLEFGLNYWLRLKNRRIEFLPEITYSKSETTDLSNFVDLESHSLTSYGFNLNVQVYPLDFEGDCDCPTWSKDGNLIDKGFYWLLSPGYYQGKLATQSSSINTDEITISGLKLGVGAGLDIGLNDLITISPFAMYQLYFGNDWLTLPQLYSLDSNSETNTNNNQIQLGVRFILRPDYK